MPTHSRCLQFFLVALLISGCQSVSHRPAKGTVESTMYAKPPALSRAEAIKKFDGALETRATVIRDEAGLLLDPVDNPDLDFQRRMKSSLSAMESRQRGLRHLERTSPPKPDVSGVPVTPQYNPLDEVVVTLDVGHEELRNILQILAKQAGVNLVLSLEPAELSRRLTISFHDTPISTVFEELMRLTDLYGRIEGNVMRVDSLQEATFKVAFLEAAFGASFGAGGDVFGAAAAAAGGSGGITGQFSVTGKGSEAKNPYERLKDILKEVLGKDDVFVIDTLAGTLYLKSKPSIVRNVASLLDKFRNAEKRQIMIEAKILEVTLDNKYKTGINWAALRSGIAITSGTTLPVSGIVIGGAEGAKLGFKVNDNVSGIFEMLKTYGDVQVVSNPSIRAKQGVPALISVGRSSAYVKEVKSETNAVTGAVTQTATVGSVFDGLMIGVIAFIHEDGHISMMVSPLKSTVNTATKATIGNNQITLPEVSLKTISTMLEMQNGDTVMLGGLIDHSDRNTHSGVPLFSDLPVVGSLFTGRSDSANASELVLLLKANVL